MLEVMKRNFSIELNNLAEIKTKSDIKYQNLKNSTEIIWDFFSCYFKKLGLKN